MVKNSKTILLGVLIILSTIAKNEGKDQIENKEHEHHQITEITIDDAKYQASLRLVSLETTKGYGHGHICAGSIITQRVILTAAHCVMDTTKKPPADRKPQEFAVVVGSANLYDEKNNKTLQYNVEKISKHKSFDWKTYKNDIAMIYLNDSIPWTWPTAKAISLNTKLLPEAKMCKMTGWERTEENCTPTKLVADTLPIISYESCKALNANATQNVICGGCGRDDVDEEYCREDAGASLVCDDQLAGVGFRVDKCGTFSNPGVFMNVSVYHDWIVKTNNTFYNKNSAKGLGASYVHMLILLCSVFSYKLF
uniref:Peptidase S1 domain-containing protein n=1 Tax=Stomoxys calcitrans TaxID=35570 RepID=A0A1I8PLM3_STOCA|nr:unnamed protein product [Stomoxys calcitrans]